MSRKRSLKPSSFDEWKERKRTREFGRESLLKVFAPSPSAPETVTDEMTGEAMRSPSAQRVKKVVDKMTVADGVKRLKEIAPHSSYAKRLLIGLRKNGYAK